jgi:hypothetical protein
VSKLPSFPKSDEIPETMRVDADAISNRWLCDGEIRVWKGENQPVLSPGQSQSHERVFAGLSRSTVSR